MLIVFEVRGSSDFLTAVFCAFEVVGDFIVTLLVFAFETLAYIGCSLTFFTEATQLDVETFPDFVVDTSFGAIAFLFGLDCTDTAVGTTGVFV